MGNRGAFRYKFRNYPCNCVGREALHAVCGEHRTPNSFGGGVLEWCVSREDAEAMLRTMQNYHEFSALRVVKWVGGQDMSAI